MSLKLWGAIGGAGAGAQNYLEERQRQEGKQELADIDHQRQLAIERMRQTHAEKLVELEAKARKGIITHEAGTQVGTVIPATTDAETQLIQERALADQETARVTAEERGAQERKTLALGEASRAGREADERVWKSMENEKDRALTEATETLKMLSSAGGSELMRDQRKRFKSQKLTKAIVAKNGFPIGAEDQPAIFDEMGTGWFIQTPNGLIRPGDINKSIEERAIDIPPGQYEPPSDDALRGLYQEPEMVDEFYRSYGFIPVRWQQAMISKGIVDGAAMLSQYAAGNTTTSLEVTETDKPTPGSR
jgi:hypothetical protein